MTVPATLISLTPNVAIWQHTYFRHHIYQKVLKYSEIQAKLKNTNNRTKSSGFRRAPCAKRIGVRHFYRLQCKIHNILRKLKWPPRKLAEHFRI